MIVSSDEYGGKSTIQPARYYDSQSGSGTFNFPTVYDWKGRFTRDKFSGPKPRFPNIKLTDMTLDRVTNTFAPLSSDFRFLAVGWNNYYITVGGCLGRLGSSKTDPPLGDGIPAAPSHANLLQRLLIDAHNKALEPDFDTPLFVAELSETLSMLRNPLKALKKFKNRKKNIKSLMDLTSSQWLQYRYGLKPLLSDVDDACQLVTKTSSRYSHVIRKTSSYSEITETPLESMWYTIPWSAPFRQVTRRIIRNSLSVTASRYYYWNENLYGPLYGNFNAGGAAGLLWELIPYSFVVDWFVGVGDWISTYRNDPRLTHKGYTATVAQNYSYKFVPEYVGYYNTKYPLYKIPDDPGHYSWNIERKQRTRPSIPAWPVLNWDFSSVTHIADGLSLLVQQIKGKRS